jgi:glutathione synthase/RimK-type ligase-like ATP-grasp enzyme
MILIITHKEDYTADFVINKLNQRGTEYLRLNCEELLTKPEFSIGSEGNFETQFKNFKKIDSIWFRRTQIPSLENLNAVEKLYFIREFDALLENIYCSLIEKRWLSNPFSIKKAENKILQLRLAKEIGFNVPKTLVTNSKVAVKDFYNSNKKNIIKPIYSGLVPNDQNISLFFTTVLTDQHIENLQNFDLTPCIFQEYIEKEYELRITVVCNKVFTSKVESQKNDNSKIDWRRDNLEFKKENLPKELEKMCVTLCKQLDINFGAIDLIKNKDGSYTFLEINPNGQWAWIEMETELKISDEIIKYLTFR